MFENRSKFTSNTFQSHAVSKFILLSIKAAGIYHASFIHITMKEACKKGEKKKRIGGYPYAPDASLKKI